MQRAAIVAALGDAALIGTEQRMGGEDFAWYLTGRPGTKTFDLHQGTFDIDEAALDVGVRYSVALAREALTAPAN